MLCELLGWGVRELSVHRTLSKGVKGGVWEGKDECERVGAGSMSMWEGCE